MTSSTLHSSSSHPQQATSGLATWPSTRRTPVTGVTGATPPQPRASDEIMGVPPGAVEPRSPGGKAGQTATDRRQPIADVGVVAAGVAGAGAAVGVTKGKGEGGARERDGNGRGGGKEEGKGEGGRRKGGEGVEEGAGAGAVGVERGGSGEVAVAGSPPRPRRMIPVLGYNPMQVYEAYEVRVFGIGVTFCD